MRKKKEETVLFYNKMKFLVEKNVKDFFKFDKVRLFKLLEVTQYASISLVVCVIMATYIDKLFPELDKNKELHITTLEVVLQFVVLILSFYYIQNPETETILKKKRLLEGQDDIGSTLEKISNIDTYEDKTLKSRPWISKND